MRETTLLQTAHVWNQQRPAMVPNAHAGTMTKSHTSQSSREEQIAIDRALVERIRQGDRKAFQEIYKQYAPSLLERIVRLVGGNMERAEDCLQQVFAQALQSIHSYKGKNVLHAWLNRLTTFVVMDSFRAQQGQQGFLTKFKWALEPRTRHQEAIPETIFAKAEIKELVHQSLDKLSAKKRMVVMLCDLEGYSVEEAAAELDIAQGTVASRLHHARKELRTHIMDACRKQQLSVEDWFHA